MSRLQEYVEHLAALYGDEVAAAPGAYSEDALLLVPDALKEFYAEYSQLHLPFGDIDTIETSLKNSKAEPFFSEGWFCFGFDGYFSFWLCRSTPDEENLSITYWDHDAGEIDGAVYESLLEFLEDMQQEYEESKADRE